MVFRGDERGQSVVIGSLLVFTILVLSFSGYQAFVVPEQNAEIEADHHRTVQDQFAELRTNVVNAVESDATRSTAIDLGATYPSRAVALNPPPAAGRLDTEEVGPVDVTEGGAPKDVCSDGGTPSTRSLVYTSNYNEYRPPQSIGYENRVVSRDYRAGTLFDQRLVDSGTISLYLLTGEVNANGVDTYSLELNASREYTTTLVDPNVRVPSRFDSDTWNEEILGEESNVTATPSGDRVRLNFTGGEYEVSCAVIGLNGEPAYTPPPDDGAAGDAAYEVRWRDPSGENGTTAPCSDTECTLDGNVSETLDLTVETIPTAEDATVRFAVSDSTVGTVTPATNETDSAGQTATTLHPEANGSVKIYAASGGSGDVIDITVENFVPLGIRAVFTDSNEKVTTAEQATGTTTLAADAQVLGPLVADIDGDSSDDIPYVNQTSGKVHIVDPDGSDETKLSSNNSHSPSLLGVGRWDGAKTSVYFAGGGQSKIYRTNPSEGDVEVVNPNGVDAVAGPANIDSDDANELVYVGSSQKLRYFEQGAEPEGNEGTIIYDQLGSSNSLGRPADFDGDGTARIPMVDGSGRLLLVDSNGDETELDSSVTNSPVAAVDWDTDGELEIMYLKDGSLKYIDDITGSQTVEDTGITEPRQTTGVT
ncbi:hypothetical protein BRC85_08085 [Halobacteriales archaeon QS_1_69_70]|nr:MAG: hypothetical protein BRC85_08085 [Halobacteriales archaeon QS_1_69_70]